MNDGIRMKKMEGFIVVKTDKFAARICVVVFCEKFHSIFLCNDI